VDDAVGADEADTGAEEADAGADEADDADATGADEAEAPGVEHSPYGDWQPTPHQASPVPQKPVLEQQKPGAQKCSKFGEPHEPSVDSVSDAGTVAVDVADEERVEVRVAVSEDVFVAVAVEHRP